MCSPRQRGSPRRGYVRLSEPEDRNWEILVWLGKAFARLGEPLRLGEGRLRLAKLVSA